MTPRSATYLIGGVLAAAATLVAGFEGLENRAYRDAAGILTVCYGHTGADIDANKEYTDEECLETLRRDIEKHASALTCIKTPLGDNQKTAFISFAFNVGRGAFCSSTLVKKANAGDLHGACAELDKWVYAGGRRLRGLVKRRAAERALCETGLK